MSVIISPSLKIAALSTLPPFPLTHARIGYDSICTETNITASSAQAGFPATAAVSPLTYETWRPVSLPATWECDNGEPTEVDYIGIGAHNLADINATITIEYSLDGVDYVLLQQFAPGDNSPIMILFAEVNARYWRVTIDAPDSNAEAKIGAIYIGIALAMQRRIYGGHSPVTLSRTATTIPTRSDGGQYLGRSVVRNGVQTNYEWENLTADWYREYFDPFAKAARTTAFFIAWYREKFPSDVGFGWTDDNISPNNQGVRDYMSVGFSFVGNSDD